MESNFRIKLVEKSNQFDITPKGYIKVFTKTNNYLPVDIDVENRFVILCAEGEQYLEKLHNFEVRKDDVWIITTPKSGTTWMLEMAWLLVNNFDYEAAKIEQRDRCIYLEYVTINPSQNTIEEANNMKSPRVLKTHLPMHLLPKGIWTVKPKIVYVSRDPKDGIVSFYHFSNGLGINSTNLEAFANEFVENRMIYNPFWSHVAEFWNLRNEPNVYFTSFERMKQNLRNEISNVGNLLGKKVSKEQMDKLVEHLKFEKMKDNVSCNNVEFVRRYQQRNGVEEKPFGVFIRKGEVGSYKEDLSDDLIQSLEEWTQRSTKSLGITPEEIFS